MHKQCIDDRSHSWKDWAKVESMIISSHNSKWGNIFFFCLQTNCENVMYDQASYKYFLGFNFLAIIFFFYFPILQHGKGAWLLSNSIVFLIVFFVFIKKNFPHAVYIYTGRFQQRGNQMPAEFTVHLRSIKWPEIFTSQPESMLFDFVMN